VTVTREEVTARIEPDEAMLKLVQEQEAVLERKFNKVVRVVDGLFPFYGDKEESRRYSRLSLHAVPLFPPAAHHIILPKGRGSDRSPVGRACRVGSHVRVQRGQLFGRRHARALRR
jgi:hypothetical protein